MFAVSKDEIKKLDAWAINELGIPEVVLMENAGRATFQTILAELGKVSNICVVCGRGKNGGDGLVIARHFFGHGQKVSVFLLADRSSISGPSRVNLDIAARLGMNVKEIKDEPSLEELSKALQDADIVIDAIFGVGFEPPLEGIAARTIDLINETRSRRKNRRPYQIVSVDIPSGLDADNGAVQPHCVKANITVTFSYPKKGLLSYPAIDQVGKLLIADIGLPKINPISQAKTPKEEPAGIEGIIEGFGIITAEMVAAKFPERNVSAHKGSCGEVFIAAGSSGMTGAAAMAAKAALRVGAGLVRVGMPKTLAPHFDSQIPEIVTIPLPETKALTLGMSSLSSLIDYYRQSDVFVIGPGLSEDPETRELVKKFLKSIHDLGLKNTLIVDADALNAVSDDTTVLKGINGNIIITPHPGEASRLLKTSVEDIQNNRNDAAKRLSKALGAVTVLKGARTVISGIDGQTFVNLTGNPGMASAGTGDVLTGAIAGISAQGASPFDSALISVFIHGMAGDVVASLKGLHGLIATDVIDALPYVIRSTLNR